MYTGAVAREAHRGVKCLLDRLLGRGWSCPFVSHAVYHPAWRDQGAACRDQGAAWRVAWHRGCAHERQASTMDGSLIPVLLCCGRAAVQIRFATVAAVVDAQATAAAEAAPDPNSVANPIVEALGDF